MNTYGYNPYSRYRSRRSQRFAYVFVMIAAIFSSVGTGYWLGQKKSGYSNHSMQDEIVSLQAQRTETMELVTKLRSDAQAANVRYQQLKDSYAEEMGTGPLPGLVDLVRTQLEQGVMPERLESVIRSSRPPENCSPPQTNKLIVHTPAYNGAESKVSLADGNILISISGSSAKNEDGKLEAWFDPTLPVVITLKSGDTEEKKEGILPIRHSVIHGDREYRFSFTEGVVSYVDITYDGCAYP